MGRCAHRAHLNESAYSYFAVQSGLSAAGPGAAILASGALNGWEWAGFGLAGYGTRTSGSDVNHPILSRRRNLTVSSQRISA